MDMLQALEPTADTEWLLTERGYDPPREVSIEACFAVSNGLLGVRGARAISRGPTWVSWLPHLKWASWPRTYVAGLFDTPNIDPPVPALVPVPDWLRVRVLLDGTPVLQHRGENLQHERILDLRRGALLTQWRHRHESGVLIKVATYRAVSLADRRLGLQLVRLEVEDEAPHELRLEARFGQMGGGLDADRLEQDLGVWRTEQSGKSLAIACTASLQLNGDEIAGRAPSPFHWSWRWTSEPGLAASFQRVIAVARKDSPEGDASEEALNALDRAKRIGWRNVLAEHEAAWTERWRLSDLELAGDDAAREALRFAIYHLNSAANPDDERVSIGARALTGDAYLGHVFWDTETYVLPFYTATWPEAARALLMYRYHLLPAARAKAARAGWRGAMFAWESADTGEETTPEQILDARGHPIQVLCGTQEQHITADVAYAVWQYWEATGDDRFMLDAGAEILLETARFWASRATLEADGRSHIRGVIGPDEYHETIDDSAYTNVMARWNIRRGIEIAAMLRERWPDRWAELSRQLGSDDAELESWAAVADTLFINFDARTGLFEQFTGFFDLEEIELSHYAGRTFPLDVVLGRQRVQRSQVVKQADVVALLGLLPEECDAKARLANFRFYEKRCGHGSSLSTGMHALVAARLGEMDTALRYFRATAAIDLHGVGESSAGGVHIAALGGLWQSAVFGFAGVSLRKAALGLDPHLPPGWQSLGFRVHWRGRLVRVDIDQDARELRVELLSGDAVPLDVRGGRHLLTAGAVHRETYRPRSA
ncbi:MAG TPA: glycosyl hydrolase family 65 protein [Acetobacteraceae bacterium]|nr:glycosyl hydrolase family 65 protein [Acetobacteraceae bacterium]